MSSRWLDRAKKLKNGGRLTDITDKIPSVSNVSSSLGGFEEKNTPSVSFVSASVHTPTEKNETQIRGVNAQNLELEASQFGNDHPHANCESIEVQAWTPSGEQVTVLAKDEAHAEQIRAWNPKPKLKSQRNIEQLPTIENPGLPEDLHELAVSYCVEIHNDDDEAIRVMLSDLMADPCVWECWASYFMQMRNAPYLVNCVQFGIG